MDHLQQKVSVHNLHSDETNKACFFSAAAKLKDPKQVVLITVTVCGAAIFIIILAVCLLLRSCLQKRNQKLEPRYEDPDFICKFRMEENIFYARTHVN